MRMGADTNASNMWMDSLRLARAHTLSHPLPLDAFMVDLHVVDTCPA
jgi:hypothetical protein